MSNYHKTIKTHKTLCKLGKHANRRLPGGETVV